MGARVRLLMPHQVWDDSRGCFFVGLKRSSKERYRGWPVYVDNFGMKIAIAGSR